MAIEYPRSFPQELKIRSVKLRIERYVKRTFLRSGYAQTVEIAPARWVGEWVTPPLTGDQNDVIMTWLDTLRGGMQMFYGADPSRARPIAHPNGISGWNGSATVTGREDFTIAFGGVPNALRLNPGDMLHMAKGVSGVMHVGLHRVTEAATASGGAISVAVEPAVNKDVFTVDTAATFYNPCALFILDPDSIEGSKSIDFDAISFSATQVI